MLASDFSTMTIDMRSGDTIAMAGVVVEFVHKSGRQARLRVTAPRDLPIKKVSHDDAEPAQVRGKHGFIRT
jgi:hypothetical protein